MRVGVVEDDLAEARFLFPRMSEGSCALCGRVVAECIDFCDVQFVWRAVLFLGQKGRLWVLFRLLVVGFRIRILIPIGWEKLFYKHLSLPFCPNLFFYHQMRSMSTKYQSNAFGSHTRSVSNQSLLRCGSIMVLERPL